MGYVLTLSLVRAFLRVRAGVLAQQTNLFWKALQTSRTEMGELDWVRVKALLAASELKLFRWLRFALVKGSAEFFPLLNHVHSSLLDF